MATEGPESLLSIAQPVSREREREKVWKREQVYQIRMREDGKERTRETNEHDSTMNIASTETQTKWVVHLSDAELLHDRKARSKLFCRVRLVRDVVDRLQAKDKLLEWDSSHRHVELSSPRAVVTTTSSWL